MWTNDKIRTYARCLQVEPQQLVNLQSRYTWRDREGHFDEVINELDRMEPCDVFVDPDTGLAPRRGTGAHVSHEDVGRLLNGDPERLVVVYQHQRRTGDWLRNLIDEASVAIDAYVCGYDGGSVGAVFFASRRRRILALTRRLRTLLGSTANARVIRAQ